MKALVEGAGGTVSVASAVGPGTTFALRLPLVAWDQTVTA